MIVLIDDLRSFRDKRDCVVLRTSQDAIEWLENNRYERINELWLDHDLGLRSHADIGAVVAVLEEAAVNGDPFDIGKVYVHTANPSGRESITRALERRGYDVEVVRFADGAIFAMWPV